MLTRDRSVNCVGEWSSSIGSVKLRFSNRSCCISMFKWERVRFWTVGSPAGPRLNLWVAIEYRLLAYCFHTSLKYSQIIDIGRERLENISRCVVTHVKMSKWIRIARYKRIHGRWPISTSVLFRELYTQLGFFRFRSNACRTPRQE